MTLYIEFTLIFATWSIAVLYFSLRIAQELEAIRKVLDERLKEKR